MMIIPYLTQSLKIILLKRLKSFKNILVGQFRQLCTEACPVTEGVVSDEQNICMGNHCHRHPSPPSTMPQPTLRCPSPFRSTFYPYSQEIARHQGITPGMTIGQQNWQVAEKVLPVGNCSGVLQAGDFSIVVQETTDLPARQAYISATEQHASAVSLDGGYRVHSYQGGRPFPIIDPSDPRAGEKAAWNFRYRDMPDSMEMRGTMQGVNNAGTIDRSNIGRMRIRFGMYRVGEEENDPQWQERGVHIKAMFESLAPSDQEGNMRITTLYDDESQANDDLSYSPQNRRTRKGYMNMLARMGGGRYDVLAEEQPPFFFIGYLHEYNWTHKGEQIMLVPGFLRADHSHI